MSDHETSQITTRHNRNRMRRAQIDQGNVRETIALIPDTLCQRFGVQSAVPLGSNPSEFFGRVMELLNENRRSLASCIASHPPVVGALLFNAPQLAIGDRECRNDGNYRANSLNPRSNLH
ncbi:hypothetical protein [Burkholderia pseudomallei]|uniref:hypothetical protein n=1 Tax=Burkholderia pseudomallei TaxID=28450 RepID=UPI0011AB7AEF|nr:hypothetical protein [Burkholderia pseudomallei]